MEKKERYIILSGRQIKDTQNQSQAFLDIETVCRLLNQQDKLIKELKGKMLILWKIKEEKTNNF